MKVTVVHDEHGRIIAVSQSVHSADLKKAGSKFERVGVIPGKGQMALDIELTADHEKMNLLDLHKLHRVDRATSKLVKV